MGKRGEGWFALQLVLFAVILLAPRWPAVVFPLWLRIAGLASWRLAACSARAACWRWAAT